VVSFDANAEALWNATALAPIAGAALHNALEDGEGGGFALCPRSLAGQNLSACERSAAS